MDGGAIAGEGGYQSAGETKDVVCPHCGEAAAPSQAVCGNCGEPLPDDGSQDLDYTDTDEMDGGGGDWGMVGVQLVGYVAAAALAVIAVVATIGPWIWRQCAQLGAH